MPVQQPRRDQDHIVLPDRQTRDRIGRGGRARNQERRRIEPHRLIDDGPGEFQPLDIQRAVDFGAFDLGRQAVLGDGIERQQIERPEQRRGGGLMAGEDHGRDLIAKLLVAEAFAAFGVARGAHQIEQVARRRAFAFAGGAALRHQFADEPRPSLAETAREKSCGVGQPSGNSRSRKCGRASRSPYSITKSRRAGP